ncbi:hypothetical protein AB5I41_08395 [Sphingomonas sp. MMS24-JH45]
MERLCEGRVALVTGAGRGVGARLRPDARAARREGRRQRPGVRRQRRRHRGNAAQEVVDAIVAAGGEAVADFSNVGDWAQAQAMVAGAVERFGGSTSSSTTRASCATGCWSTSARRIGTR